MEIQKSRLSKLGILIVVILMLLKIDKINQVLWFHRLYSFFFLTCVDLINRHKLRMAKPGIESCLLSIYCIRKGLLSLLKHYFVGTLNIIQSFFDDWHLVLAGPSWLNPIHADLDLSCTVYLNNNRFFSGWWMTDSEILPSLACTHIHFHFYRNWRQRQIPIMRKHPCQKRRREHKRGRRDMERLHTIPVATIYY